ncbi:MAG: TonB-dependent receptor [Acidobacteria bacterium]|nr:TonB-dependent receptor [Acidobacteriota bacterium]
MTRILRVVCILALTFLVTTAVAWAQLATAELNGRVTDSSGAVLPGVTVTATQTATGLVRTVVTDGDGHYLISNLPTGPYRLEVSLQGFKTHVQTGLVLQVGATPTVNAALDLGSLEESVTVEAAAPIVDVRSAGISEVVENERIVELPLQGRQVTDLLVISGAAVQTGSVSSRGTPGGVNISVAGGLSTGVGYTLDGAVHANPQQNANLPLPFPDALQEFRIATSGLSAQNGVHSGASVNAVTKSGTNRFSGNGFEFLRHHRFNAASPFATLGKDGTRVDDGLKRNQFGGTFGGPVVKDKLFFFGAYQGTALRQRPNSNVAFVPTAAMLAGDFTDFTSPACNGGRQVALRAPYVNNRINPALYSPAALNLAKRLPSTTDPCGLITFDVVSNRDEAQPIVRVDYQMGTGHSLFGRYMASRYTQPPGYDGGTDNVLKSDTPGAADMVHSMTVGETTIFSSSVVNALRLAVNKARVDNYQTPFFSPRDIGANIYSYLPGYMSMNVTGGFVLYSGTNTKALFFNDTYQVADDLTVVRGNHQFGVGANVQYWTGDYTSTSRANGNWIFNGSATGLGLADLLVGRVTTVEHGGFGKLPVDSTYLGLYAQDAWRVTNRVTVNGGVRWEPYFGQNVRNGVISVFNMENFKRGIKSKVFLKAPAGLLYAGDEGFPANGKTGMNKQWWNLSPRGGVAWDVRGDGRLAVRSSYAMAYDFMAGEYHNIDANAPPFGNRSLITDPTGLFDNPYAGVGGDPHPIVTNANTDYVAFGTFGTMDPDINSPRIQSWNVTLEQQFGSQWGVAASYLGSHSDRLWAQVARNPGVYMGLGPCVINSVSYPVCSTNANLNQRRLLYQQSPREAAFIGALDENTAIGYQNYKGLKLSAQRRSAGGLGLNGNYTISRCTGTPTANTFNQQSAGYIKPNDPSYDDGYCNQDRTHIGTLTMVYETPDIGGPAMRVIASHWRVSGILSARSGGRLNIIVGQDNAFTGLAAQRPNKLSDDFYASEQTLTNYFNRSAFAQPAPGTLGDLTRNAVVGPSYWNVDLALSRLISLSATQRVELRLESFNLLNTFNWGDPLVNLNAGTFGRITTQAGAPRIMQFGIKYDF